MVSNIIYFSTCFKLSIESIVDILMTNSIDLLW